MLTVPNKFMKFVYTYIQHFPSSSHARQNNLPPKKRFENQNVPSYKEGEASSLNKEYKTEESKTVSILPGVIRHTACPDSSLAYYYDYNTSSQ